MNSIAKTVLYTEEDFEQYYQEQIARYGESIQYQPKYGYEMIKRIAEILICLILLLPVTIVITLLGIIIKLESEGPIIFSQVRVGKEGKLVKVHKLRSMRKDAEANGQKWAEKDDPRITRVGRFIRKVRLDEIPQIFDILNGSMSIIGPRPEVPKLTKEFEKKYPGFIVRLMIRPGLTGHAQVNGGYDLGPDEKVVYDKYYIEHRGLLLDMKIVFMTIKTIFTRDGAR